MEKSDEEQAYSRVSSDEGGSIAESDVCSEMLVEVKRREAWEHLEKEHCKLLCPKKNKEKRGVREGQAGARSDRAPWAAARACDLILSLEAVGEHERRSGMRGSSIVNALSSTRHHNHKVETTQIPISR